MRKALLLSAALIVLPAAAQAQTILNWALGTGADPKTVYVRDTTGANVPVGLLNSTTHALSLNAAGASGNLQYDNGGVLGGVAGYNLCAACYLGTPALTLTGQVNVTATGASFFSFVNGSTSTAWLTFPTLGTTGGTLNFNSVSNINWANAAYLSESGGILDVGAITGTIGDHTGTLQLATLHAFTQLQLTDASLNTIDQFNASQADTYTNLVLHPSATNNTILEPTPIAVTGSSSISQGQVASGQGLNISGSPGGSFNCDPLSSYCMARQMDYWSSDDGFEIFGVEIGASDHHGLELGLSRNANDMQHVAQLLPLDHISAPGGAQHFNITAPGSGYSSASAALTGTGCSRAPSTPADVELYAGQVTGISIHYDPGAGCSSIAVVISGTGTGATATTTLTAGATDAKTGPDVMVLHASGAITEPAWWGFGQADLGLNRIRFGATVDSGHAWASANTTQPTLAFSGPLEWDTPNAGGETGFTDDFSIRDVSGILNVTNVAGSANAPIKVSFERPVAVTLAQLNTADPTPADGDAGFVNDATSCTFGSPPGSGGSTHCPLHWDASSSSWKAG